MQKKIKFGTDGWRAVIADDFTFYNVSLVTIAIGNYLKNNKTTKRGIFIGYDNRFLSEYFAKRVSLILSGEGFITYLSRDSVPTPLTAFMVKDMRLDGGIMITASHNPPVYNGIKFIPDYGGPAEDKITKEIEKNLNLLIEDNRTDTILQKYLNSGVTFEDDPDASKSNINWISDYENYKKKLLGIVDSKSIIEIKPGMALDTMFGAGSKIFPEVLRNGLQLDFKIINNYRDVLFGGRLPDPSTESNLDTLKKIVLKNNLDIGTALDGDADRFGAIDGKGVFISPNNAISLILYYFTETGKFSTSDVAVRTVATTHLIDEICLKNGMEVIETPVGFKYVGKEMLKGNVLIGGEESGGLSVKGHIPEKDGLLACLLLTEIQSYLKKNYGTFYLSDYLSKIYEEFGTYYNIRLDFEIPSNY
ncbi:MAG: phosphoglucomutase/phosphomannomutase family protein, partial [Actinobacteria bacterium]|nr:phosphoglucomutase/phosphomannomutase family protein [Actinomycetota bacterium]